MKKFGYGVLAFLPLTEVILSVILMILGIVFLVMVAAGSMNMSSAVPIILLWAGIGGLILGIVLCVVGAIVFCGHVKKNDRISEDAKKGWMVSLITLVCFAFPAYWIKCIK